MQTTVTMERGDIQATVGVDGVKVEDVRAYSPRLITAMSLEDAITFAKAILAFAEDNAEEIEDEDSWFDYMARQEELKNEARWDAISERV